jgi:quinol-cytochrome oxidoreductase complex cytochrome b subunit
MGTGLNNVYGFLLFVSFVVQIVTGVLLSFYYSSSSIIAFESVYYLSFNVFYGFVVRLLHVVGSFVCIYLLYLHFLRSFYYTCSYILSKSFLYVYASGLLILILSLLVSFIGYTLC